MALWQLEKKVWNQTVLQKVAIWKRLWSALRML
jgi:hypothetical protein